MANLICRLDAAECRSRCVTSGDYGHGDSSDALTPDQADSHAMAQGAHQTASSRPLKVIALGDIEYLGGVAGDINPSEWVCIDAGKRQGCGRTMDSRHDIDGGPRAWIDRAGLVHPSSADAVLCRR